MKFILYGYKDNKEKRLAKTKTYNECYDLMKIAEKEYTQCRIEAVSKRRCGNVQ